MANFLETVLREWSASSKTNDHQQSQPVLNISVSDPDPVFLVNPDLDVLMIKNSKILK